MMSDAKMGDLVPARGVECIECEILTIEKCNLPNYHRPGCTCGGLGVKCVFHGEHQGHRLRLSAYSEKDGTWSNRYYCDDCHNWAWKRKAEA